MAVNWWGVASLVFFYMIVLAVGMFAARKLKKKNQGVLSKDEDAMLAGRSIGVVIGTFCLTATWVDGGLINGSAEAIYTKGILWCQAPFGYAMSLIIGGLFFAKPMRDKEYVTMLDPFQDLYGPKIGGLLYLPALCGEMFWTAAILTALGSTITVILDLQPWISIIVSGVIAVLYTLAGGLYSVSYTDVIDIIFIFFGLWLCVPFILLNNHVKNLNDHDWVGHIESVDIIPYTEGFLQLIFGGLPWQVYFQRVLACKNSFQAQVLSIIAGFGVVFMAIPAFVIGVACKATAWDETQYGKNITTDEVATNVLPMALEYLTPTWVAFFGLGAVSAAVMSSCDASILSASSMFTKNIYKQFRTKAGETEVLWVLRLAMVVEGTLATLMALTVKSIYTLFYLCSDLVYVILFPQLVCVIYLPTYCNSYGALSGYILALFLRVAGGEPSFSFAPLIYYPNYDYQQGIQTFPFKTVAMVCGFVLLLLVSALTEKIFSSGCLPAKYDVFRGTSVSKEANKQIATELEPTIFKNHKVSTLTSTHM